MYFDEHEFESHENENNDGEPSTYELHCQRIQESNLKRQIARHGDEEMRVGCQAPVGITPTESFVRSYQFKMPHTSVKKTEAPNPCKRLMKSMNIKMMDPTKTRKGAYDDH